MGYELEQKTVYFLMTPLSFSGGSQDTYTTELEAAAAFTPPGGPGTAVKKVRPVKVFYSVERLLNGTVYLK